ncbi:MAG: septal ring lytic transglycosylase RlpA family protein [Deltaproteobacteria bacterium]
MTRLVVAVIVVLAACGGGDHHARVQEPSHGQSMYRGYATFYSESQMTASGERFDKHALTAAHRTLKLGTRVRVTNQKNGRSVVVRINDRGPFGNKGRIIDLSEAAAKQLDMIEAGVVPVTLEVLP